MCIPEIVPHLPHIVYAYCQDALKKEYLNKVISAKYLATPFIVQYGDKM